VDVAVLFFVEMSCYLVRISPVLLFAKAPYLWHASSVLTLPFKRRDVKCECPSSKQPAGHRTFFSSREKWKRKREKKNSGAVKRTNLPSTRSVESLAATVFSKVFFFFFFMCPIANVFICSGLMKPDLCFMRQRAYTVLASSRFRLRDLPRSEKVINGDAWIRCREE